MGGQAVTRWDTLSSPALEAADKLTPVVLPIAATEQHGPHLPLATDRMIADRLANDLEGRLGAGVLILPTVAVGCSDSHLGFAGTLTVRHDTLLRYVENLGDSVFKAGFTSLLILNTHGGNQAVAQLALDRLGPRHRDRRIASTSWWRVAQAELLMISDTGPGGVGHACELETSIMLVIAPELVRIDLAPERLNSPAIPCDDADMLRGSRASLYRRSEQIAATGVFGAPRAATIEKGRRALAAVSDALETLVRSLQEAP